MITIYLTFGNIVVYFTLKDIISDKREKLLKLKESAFSSVVLL